METILNLINDPLLGITSQTKLWAEVRKRKIPISRAESNRIFRESTEELGRVPVRPTIPIKCPRGTVGCLQADLMDVTKYATRNSGYKYILNVVDIYSRFVWSFPLKSKSPAVVAPKLESIFQEIKRKHPESQISLQVDEGTEFKGRVLAVCKEHNVTHLPTLEKGNMMIVERFNRTLWELFRNVLLRTGKANFLQYHAALIEKYNDTVHTKTRQKPVDVFGDKEDKKIPYHEPDGVFKNGKIIWNQKSNLGGYKVGDLVRTSNKAKLFDKKSATLQFSETVYRIQEVIGNRFVLVNVKTGQELKKRYLARELKPSSGVERNVGVEPEIRAVSKVARRARLQRQEPAFADKDHKVDDYGNVEFVEKRMVPVREKRVRVAKKYFDIEGRGVDGIFFM